MVLDPQENETRRMETTRRGPGMGRIGDDARGALSTIDFWIYAAAVLAVLLAALIVDGDDRGGDPFRAGEAWRLVAFRTIG